MTFKLFYVFIIKTSWVEKKLILININVKYQ